MPVYFVRAGNTGAVKIGCTSEACFAARIAAIQVGNPDRINVIRTVVGGIDVEAQIHHRFAANRLRGEWFTFDPDMMGDLGAPDWTPPAAATYAYKGRAWTPERRQARAQMMKASWRDPAVREQRITNIRANWADRLRRATAGRSMTPPT